MLLSRKASSSPYERGRERENIYNLPKHSVPHDGKNMRKSGNNDIKHNPSILVIHEEDGRE